jgi:hypothetical protein
MSDLKSIIRSRKAQNMSPDDMRAFLIQTAEDVVAHKMQTIEATLRSELATEVDSALTAMLRAQLTGEKGEQGETVVGPQGPKGEQGDSIVGPQGPQGEKGDTIVGPKGDKGDKGDAGSPDTPAQIAAKVNTLEETIEQKTIKGLPKLIENLQRSIREKPTAPKAQSGGGMGNWVHQRFSTSSATTTVTTDHRAAAGGMAHILRYNGQVQDYGTDYTLGGDQRTYTFTFTLDDSSVVSIAYVRT